MTNLAHVMAKYDITTETQQISRYEWQITILKNGNKFKTYIYQGAKLPKAHDMIHSVLFHLEHFDFNRADKWCDYYDLKYSNEGALARVKANAQAWLNAVGPQGLADLQKACKTY